MLPAQQKIHVPWRFRRHPTRTPFRPVRNRNSLKRSSSRPPQTFAISLLVRVCRPFPNDDDDDAAGCWLRGKQSEGKLMRSDSQLVFSNRAAGAQRRHMLCFG